MNLVQVQFLEDTGCGAEQNPLRWLSVSCPAGPGASGGQGAAVVWISNSHFEIFLGSWWYFPGECLQIFWEV